MKFPSLIGWALLGVAFFTAAAETVTYSVPGVGGMIVSAYDLWYTISPKSLVIARINIERNLPPLFWDPLLVTVLQLPAWLIFGIPGAAMAWFFRPPREKDVEIEEDSIFLYDRLVEAAREENMLEDYPLEILTSLPMPPSWRTGTTTTPILRTPPPRRTWAMTTTIPRKPPPRRTAAPTSRTAIRTAAPDADQPRPPAARRAFAI
jgi:hypothetical protein